MTELKSVWPAIRLIMMSGWLIDWLIDWWWWVTDWLIDWWWVTDWLIDDERLIDDEIDEWLMMNEWLIDEDEWLIDEIDEDWWWVIDWSMKLMSDWWDRLMLSNQTLFQYPVSASLISNLQSLPVMSNCLTLHAN